MTVVVACDAGRRSARAILVRLGRVTVGSAGIGPFDEGCSFISRSAQCREFAFEAPQPHTAPTCGAAKTGMMHCLVGPAEVHPTKIALGHRDTRKKVPASPVSRTPGVGRYRVCVRWERDLSGGAGSYARDARRSRVLRPSVCYRSVSQLWSQCPVRRVFAPRDTCHRHRWAWGRWRLAARAVALGLAGRVRLNWRGQ